MKTSLIVLFLCISGVCGIAQSTDAQATPSKALLVLSKQERVLAIIDPATLNVLARVPVGNDPHEVIASADGGTAYVSNYGGGTFRTLAVVDLLSQKALPAIDLGALRGPHGLTFVGGKTWFTAEGSKAIGSYDPNTKTVDWIMGTGQNRTHMIYVSDDLSRIVTTNVSSGTVSVIEKAEVVSGPGAQARMDWNETVIPVGRGSEGFDVSPDQKEIWVANAGDGTISVIDFAQKKVVETIAADVPSANRLKFTRDGKYAFVSTLRGPDLVILSTAERKVVKRVPIGHGAAGILMQPDGARAYVACTPDNYVAVIDVASMTMTGKIENIGQPDGLAWATRP